MLPCVVDSSGVSARDKVFVPVVNPSVDAVRIVVMLKDVLPSIRMLAVVGGSSSSHRREAPSQVSVLGWRCVDTLLDADR
jgi:hypothetical protein